MKCHLLKGGKSIQGYEPRIRKKNGLWKCNRHCNYKSENTSYNKNSWTQITDVRQTEGTTTDNLKHHYYLAALPHVWLCSGCGSRYSVFTVICQFSGEKKHQILLCCWFVASCLFPPQHKVNGGINAIFFFCFVMQWPIKKDRYYTSQCSSKIKKWYYTSQEEWLQNEGSQVDR